MNVYNIKIQFTIFLVRTHEQEESLCSSVSLDARREIGIITTLYKIINGQGGAFFNIEKIVHFM